jgi:glycerol uptake facilitator-like aquaporin
MAVSDKRNSELPHGTAAIIVGFTITVLGASFAFNCGNAINPARDLAPRLFTFMAGWGSQTFTSGNYFFWIPIVGPMCGSVLGSLVYILTISAHWNRV